MNLLAARRFLPLFVVQALGALNDNLFKNALAVLVVFRSESAGPVLVALAGGVFILPYAVFSATAGALADRFDKARVLRITKLGELALMLFGAWALLAGSTVSLFIVLFGLGVQAAFFGPLKYGLLPEQLAPEELVAGNGLIESGTFLAILLGTIGGGALILGRGGPGLIAACCIVVAVLGVCAAWFVPLGAPAAPGLRIRRNLLAETAAVLGQARGNRPVWIATLGLSWFWSLGSIFIAEFPVLAHGRFAAGSSVVTLMLTMFALGIGAGSMLAGRLLHGDISARHVPLAAIVLSLAGLDFGRICLGVGPATGWQTAGAMLTSATGAHALAELVLVAVAGGVFSVPLYAVLQRAAAPAARARMIAANNVMNALFMVAAALVLAALSKAGISAPAILIVASALNLLAAAWLWRRQPALQLLPA